ncbi:MAG: 3-ketoacyl-CoA thiolase @ Acetyl-CoA acetyltransferase [uncultured Sphingomonadaceae bacterium]|uniref:3-ketoacyl-CoA thiolase @ Acetyl-CoA acetyltransferase n=1 Tax=uncultured Sphingomonadaceae bacterium TaxID=169976 RepID=A0A6J4TC11_9SPHN|nr:MAG: 3-ketoacyl-CoA thiolase @ Acetyl-CoA acetyltransferase [uncultured Sphingomonadaceae bacterium]
MAHDPVVILSYARTPIGSFNGALAGVPATELGATAVRQAVARAGVEGSAIDRIYMGCVLSAGLGQAPARQAGIKAGLPQSVEATTVNKMCGSGMQAAIMGAEALAAGSVELVVAGGMESMSGAPYLSPAHRSGARMGHDRLLDHMMLDGLEDAYEPGRAMGTFGDDAAREYQLTRQGQDEFAIASMERAKKAQESGAFDREIVGVEVTSRKGTLVVDKDEEPQRAFDAAKVSTLRPAFSKDGTITAANASKISDGAAALVLTRESVAERLGVKPVARLLAHAAHAQEPARFTSAPVGAVRKLLERAGWSARDIELFEVNEAFACVAMIAMRDLGIEHGITNVHGGATALGHPIGASGARIMATLLSAMETHGRKRGVASLCIGGGEATAVAVELVD